MSPAPLDGPVAERRAAGADRLIRQEALQVLGHFLGRGVTILRALPKRLEHNGFQIMGNSRIESSRRPGLRRGYLSYELVAIRFREGRMQRQQFVERRAERINIRALIDQAALG